VYDGAPSENIIGADLHGDFMQLGYELFKDKDTLKTKFLEADIFDPESSLKPLERKMGIIYVGAFLHLFGWDKQVQVAKRLVELSTPKKGSLVLGRQVGSINPGAVMHSTNSENQMYRHDPVTFEKLWKQVGDETGTSWKVDAKLDTVEGFGQGQKVAWMGPDVRRLIFSVERL
jgi:hypothetical protein